MRKAPIKNPGDLLQRAEAVGAQKIVLILPHSTTVFRMMIARSAPALLSALPFLLGTAYGLEHHWVYLVSLALLCFCQRISLLLLCFLVGMGLAIYRVPSIDLQGEKVEGVAHFFPSRVQYHDSPFQRSLLYKGVVHHFTATDGTTLSQLPCSIFLPPSLSRPKADSSFIIRGTLDQKAPHLFVLKPTKNIPWERTSRSTPFVEQRFLAKQKLLSYLKRHFSDPGTRSLLQALATGDVDERLLSLEFSRIGVQHILAISGFHFALITLFLGTLLRLFLTRKLSIIFLLCSLSTYWFFLGSSPSVERAWIAIFLSLVGQLAGLKISGLNALGIGLWVEILGNPLVLEHMGFQLSFLCTLAILLLYPHLLVLAHKCLPKRPLKQTLSFSLPDQHGYLLCHMIKQSVALNLAVHLLTLLPLLYLFHQFPLLSLLYNLFFPFWVSISLLLLLFGLLLSPLPPLAHAIHFLNASWTRFALDVSGNPPACLDYSVCCPNLPYPVVILSLVLVFLYANARPIGNTR